MLLLFLPFSFLLFKAKKRISVVTSYTNQIKVQKNKIKDPEKAPNTCEKVCNRFLKITSSEKQAG